MLAELNTSLFEQQPRAQRPGRIVFVADYQFRLHVRGLFV
jgi:hypothetical protein